MGSRDVTNYSLLHCASIFADARALNTLIKAGSIFFQSYHFTPLNISLLLYYRRQLDEILKIKIIPKVGSPNISLFSGLKMSGTYDLVCNCDALR